MFRWTSCQSQPNLDLSNETFATSGMFQSFPLNRRGGALNVRKINMRHISIPAPSRRSFETRQMSVLLNHSAAATEMRLERKRLSTLICSNQRHDPDIKTDSDRRDVTVHVNNVCLIRSNNFNRGTFLFPGSIFS